MKFGICGSKYVMLSYSKRFLTKKKTSKISKKQQKIWPGLIKYIPAGPISLPFPVDLEGSLLINAQAGEGGEGSLYWQEVMVTCSGLAKLGQGGALRCV